MKFTFYTVGDLSTECSNIGNVEKLLVGQYGIRYVLENGEDWKVDRLIYEYCRDNGVEYLLVRGATDDSTHVRFLTDSERMEFVLKWF